MKNYKDDPMYDIFILYTRKDRKFAHMLAEALESNGYKVWWDIELLPVDGYREKIENIINKSSLTLVLWSEWSVQCDFVKKKASHALKINRLIPLRIDNTELPLPAGKIHTPDISHWNGDSKDQLLTDLLKSIGKSIGNSAYENKDSSNVSKNRSRPLKKKARSIRKLPGIRKCKAVREKKSGRWDMEELAAAMPEELEIPKMTLSQKDPPRRAYALLDCPDSVPIMKEFTVTIGLSKEKVLGVTGGELRRPDSSVGSYTLKVRLICDGFRFKDGETNEIVLCVTANNPYPKEERHLTALLDISFNDSRVLMAQFSVDGQMIGAAARSIEVRRDITETPCINDKLKVPGVDMVVPPLKNAPDLTITITSGNTALGDRLIWSMDTIHPEVGERFPENEDLSTDLGDSPAVWAKTLMNKVNSKEGAIDLEPFLIGTGETIANKIPYAIRKKLVELSNHITDRAPTLLIISGEPHVPWELAYTALGERGKNFLAMEFVIGRWVLGYRDVETGKLKPPLPPPVSLTVNNMYVISGDYSETKGWKRLEEAEKESENLQKRYNATPINATLEEIVTWLNKGVGAELIHFSVHGKYDPTGVKDGLAMVDGQMLEPTVIRAYTLKHQSFVFLNACQVGQGNTILGDYGGMAEAFLHAGASGVIAPLWSVDDESARNIAERFYTGLKAGKDPAEMVRRERQNFESNPRSGTFLAYQFFGHPKMQIGMELCTGEHNDE